MTSTEMETKLNQVVKSYFEDLNNKLNENVIPLGDLQPGNIYHVPKIVSLGGGVTIASAKDEAFNLKPPVAGNVKDSILKAEDKPCTVVRRIIGYSMASRIVAENDPNYTKRALTPLITEAILTLKKEVGFGPELPSYGNSWGTFKRPGQNDGYFRECEHSVGFELRLFGDSICLLDKGLIK